MRIGIIALVLVFFLSGAKNLQDAGLFRKGDKCDAHRRKLYFGLLLVIMGLLVGVYYVITL